MLCICASSSDNSTKFIDAEQRYKSKKSQGKKVAGIIRFNRKKRGLIVKTNGPRSWEADTSRQKAN